MRSQGSYQLRGGFTLMEIIIVVVIISIAALLAVPMFSSAANSQIKSAANVIAADIEYAKSMAISRQQNYSVIFDTANDAYSIVDSGGSVIDHPVRGGTYSIDLADTLDLGRVDISGADFDGAQKITFDYLGSPYNESGSPLNSGQIVLGADEFGMTITVEPVTGYVTIQ